MADDTGTVSRSPKDFDMRQDSKYKTELFTQEIKVEKENKSHRKNEKSKTLGEDGKNSKFSLRKPTIYTENSEESFDNRVSPIKEAIMGNMQEVSVVKLSNEDLLDSSAKPISSYIIH